jgi:hypothetical protein
VAAYQYKDTDGGVPLLGWPLLIVVTTALAMVLPFLFFGNPSGHDFEFHLHSWLEVLSQWQHAIVYPRWAALAHYGYGEARFIFYPPASWVLGAALGAALPWKVVPGAYVWLALTLSGCSMFLLARRWLARGEAILAAAFYTANPYYIVIVYWRSAFAELLAGALLPLLVLCVLRLDQLRWKATVPLGLVIAVACATNVPSSVMVCYSVVLLALTMAVTRRSPRVLIYAALAGLLGAALAAFYIFPATYEQKWVNIGQVLAAGVRPQDNFLFTRIDDPDHNRFNLLVSLVASAEMITIAIAAFCLRKQRNRQAELWWPCLVWICAIALLMFSVSAMPWAHLPLLRFVQLPWRWLLCFNVIFALAVPLAWKHWSGQAMACFVMLAVLAFVWVRIQPPWWDTADGIADLVEQHRSGGGYEGTDEYVPAGADPYDVKPDAPRVALDGGGAARVQVAQWSPETKLFNAEIGQPGKLVLRLFNYPAWQVTVNGREVETETRDDTGQMIIPVQAGENRVRITFVRTWDRTLGAIASGVTALFVAVFSLFRQKSRDP